MKNKFLTLLFLFLSSFNFACPVWHVGDLFIVNEKNIPLNAQLWKVYWSENRKIRDSFLIDRNVHWDYNLKKHDSVFNRRCIYNHNLWTSDNRQMFRIQAEGFSDLIIKEISFINLRKGTPRLTVKMYPASYQKTGKNISLFTEYIYEGKIEVRDSMVIGLSDYMKSIKEVSSAKSSQTAEKLLLVETYPNPVRDHITLDIHCSVKEPWSMQITDISGKQVSTISITQSSTTFNLESMPQGTYILVVYNNQKVPVYSRRFLLQRL